MWILENLFYNLFCRAKDQETHTIQKNKSEDSYHSYSIYYEVIEIKRVW